MATIHLDARTVWLRLPALYASHFCGTVVVRLTQSIELRIERRIRQSRARRVATDRALARRDRDRTDALAYRLPGF